MREPHKRELDYKKREKNRNAGKNTFAQGGFFCSRDDQGKGHSVHPVSCYRNQREDDGNVHLCMRRMNEDKLAGRTGSVKQGGGDRAAASAQEVLNICESVYLQLFAGLHEKEQCHLYAHTL